MQNIAKQGTSSTHFSWKACGMINQGQLYVFVLIKDYTAEDGCRKGLR